MNSNTLASRERLLSEQTSSGIGGNRKPVDARHPPLRQIVVASFMQLLTHRRKNFGGLNDY